MPDLRVLPIVLAAASVWLAGCSGAPAAQDVATGTVELRLADNLASGNLTLRGAYLRSVDGVWVETAGNGTKLSLVGSGGNASVSDAVPVGTYDRARLLFAALDVGGRPVVLTQSGIEVQANVTVLEGKLTILALAFSWDESLFQSTAGTAFSPFLSVLVVVQDGTETTRLAASEIVTGSTKPPVARMRIFDATGLEVFASSFVAESPEAVVVGNAGNLTLSGAASEAVEAGATLTTFEWDIGGVKLQGTNVRYVVPVNGGQIPIRLTVTDSEDATDTQSIKVAFKPGTTTRQLNFTGTTSGATQANAAGSTPGNHPFELNTTSLDGVPAQLVRIVVVLEPGAATVPVSDLDLRLLDNGGAVAAQATGAGSQHRIDKPYPDPPASGTWKVVVDPRLAYDADYVVRLTMTWKGVNPAIEAFLSAYDDGHSHEH